MEKFKAHLKSNWLKYLIIILVLAVDMLTKFLLVPLDASNNIDTSKSVSKSLIGNFLWLYPSLNDGAGFSILSGKAIFLIVLTIVFIVMLFIYDLLKPQKSKLYNIAIGLIFAGAFGNLIDRLAFGGVVRDFIYFKFINFPVFNIADMALTFGIICFLVWFLFLQKKQQSKEVVENKENIVNEQNNLEKNNSIYKSDASNGEDNERDNM